MIILLLLSNDVRLFNVWWDSLFTQNTYSCIVICSIHWRLWYKLVLQYLSRWYDICFYVANLIRYIFPTHTKEYRQSYRVVVVAARLCNFIMLMALNITPPVKLRRRTVTARFVTRFNLWLRHDLWPHNASICDPARFVPKSASIRDQRYTMILESKLCRGKLVFVFTLIMYTKWYNMIICVWIVI